MREHAGYRAHNETLLLQGEALRLLSDGLRLQSEALQIQTMASMKRTNAANKWSYCQTKHLFHLMSKITLDLLNGLATSDCTKDELKAVSAKHRKKVDKYDKELPEIEAEGHAIVKQSDELLTRSKEKLAEYQEKMEESQYKMAERHVANMRSNRFDYDELGLKLGVVLCSLAILTKGRGFWFVGIIRSLIGAVVAISGLLRQFIGH